MKSFLIIILASTLVFADQPKLGTSSGLVEVTKAVGGSSTNQTLTTPTFQGIATFQGTGSQIILADTNIVNGAGDNKVIIGNGGSAAFSLIASNAVGLSYYGPDASGNTAIASDTGKSFTINSTDLTGSSDKLLYRDATGKWKQVSSLVNLTFSGGVLSASATGGGAFDIDTNTIPVVSTTNETTIYTNNIPANSLAKHCAILRIYGSSLNNSGGASTFIVKLYVGTNAVNGGVTTSLANNTSRMDVKFEAAVFGTGPASQFVESYLWFSAKGSPSFGSGGLYSSTPGNQGSIYGNATADSTSTVPIAVTVTPAGSNASFDLTKNAAILIIY